MQGGIAASMGQKFLTLSRDAMAIVGGNYNEHKQVITASIPSAHLTKYIHQRSVRVILNTLFPASVANILQRHHLVGLLCACEYSNSILHFFSLSCLMKLPFLVFVIDIDKLYVALNFDGFCYFLGDHSTYLVQIHCFSEAWSALAGVLLHSHEKILPTSRILLLRPKRRQEQRGKRAQVVFLWSLLSIGATVSGVIHGNHNKLQLSKSLVLRIWPWNGLDNALAMQS